MKKLLFLLAFTAGVSLAAQAQVTMDFISKGQVWYHGFKNTVTGEWIVDPIFRNIENIGGRYYRVWSFENKYGMYSLRGQEILPPIFDTFTQLKTTQGDDLGMYAVKLKGKWGVMTEQQQMIVDPVYDNIYPVPAGTRFEWWEDDGSMNGAEKYAVYNEREMIRLRDEQLRKITEAEDARREAELAAAARTKKEAELSSFTTYAKLYVEPKVDQWQKKDEFETTEEYKQRVTGFNRQQMIEKLTAEARELFLSEHAELNKNAAFSLGTYDADNQVYMVHSDLFGDMLLAVPRGDAPAFKQNFASYAAADRKYFINNDKIGLSEFVLRSADGTKEYKYNNRLALTYNTYDVDMAAFEFSPIDIPKVSTAVSQGAAATGSVTIQGGGASYAKPTLRILSPASGSDYSTPEIVIRYEATTGDGGQPEIEVWVNGKPYAEKQTAPATAKGVKRSGSELTLNLPQEPGECYVMLQVIDSQGDIKQDRLILNYTGGKPKPNLHIMAVGVGDYNQPVLRLQQAAKDARDFVDIVTGSDVSQYGSVAEPILLTDKAATEKEVKRALRQLEYATGQEDVVMMFFSGHGDKEGNETYFLPVDAEKEDLLSTAVDFDVINKVMQRLVDKNCRVVVFMDACYSGTLGAKGVNDDITFAAPGIIGFYSSTANQQSVESSEWNNGVFTKVLLDGLRGGAVDQDGSVSVYRLQSFISDGVKSRTNGKQSPIIRNSHGDLVLFRP